VSYVVVASSKLKPHPISDNPMEVKKIITFLPRLKKKHSQCSLVSKSISGFNFYALKN
jgi:hypothetical protein